MRMSTLFGNERHVEMVESTELMDVQGPESEGKDMKLGGIAFVRFPPVLLLSVNTALC